jgi:hypothetical protein
MLYGIVTARTIERLLLSKVANKHAPMAVQCLACPQEVNHTVGVQVQQGVVFEDVFESSVNQLDQWEKVTHLVGKESEK